MGESTSGRERPILFSGAMVKAILAGTKRQTRRIVRSPARNMQRAGDQVIAHRLVGDSWYGDHVWSMRDRDGVWNDYTAEQFLEFCPYGQPGDRLWVKETWAAPPGHYDLMAPREIPSGVPIRYAVDGVIKGEGDRFRDAEGRFAIGRGRPSIFMRRWMSRRTLEITEIRVERLQDISEEDARAEGVETHPIEWDADAGAPLEREPARAAFARLWDSINADRANWASNPWVWVVGFKVAEVRR